MTTPSLARQTSTGDRVYAWPPQPPYEFEVASVTNSIGNGYPKPFLIPWAAKVTAEAAVDDFEIIKAMLEKDNEKAAIDYLKNARNRIMSSKADRGTIVHAALEAHFNNEPLQPEVLAEQLKEARVPKNLWDSTHGMITAVMKFLEEWDIEMFHSEQTVFSRTHEYAGTADIIGRSAISRAPGADRHNVVIDVKTGKSVYDDTAMQLTSYARADFVGMDDGTEVPLTPDGSPIEWGIVVRPMANGKYERVVFSLNDDVFDLFLHCQAIAGAKNVLKRSRRP